VEEGINATRRTQTFETSEGLGATTPTSLMRIDQSDCFSMGTATNSSGVFFGF
jgi:hypothetical protein